MENGSRSRRLRSNSEGRFVRLSIIVLIASSLIALLLVKPTEFDSPPNAAKTVSLHNKDEPFQNDSTATSSEKDRRSAEQNPFHLKYSRLPLVVPVPQRKFARPSAAPDNLPRNLAVPAIRKVFGEAGIALTPKLYNSKQGAFRIDGFNEEERLGFVFADRGSLEIDAITSTYIEPWKTEAANLTQRLRDWEIDHPQYAPLGGRLIDIQYRLHPELEPLSDEFQPLSLADPVKRAIHFHSLFMRYQQQILRRSRLALSMDEVRELHQRTEDGEQFIAVISASDYRFVIDDHSHHSPSPNRAVRNEPTARESEIAKQKSVLALKRTVREFIAWARKRRSE